MKINIKFQYNMKEYVKATRKYLIASKIISKSSIVIIPMIFMASIINIIFINQDFLDVLVFSASLFAMITGLTLYFYIPVKTFKTVNNDKGICNLEFTKNEIVITNNIINSKVDMKVYREIWESEEFYFLIQAKNVYAILPKRAFSNKKQKQDFEMLMLEIFEVIKKI